MALLNQPTLPHSDSQKGWILITVLAMLTVLGILGLGTLAPQRLQNQAAMSHRQHASARNLAINYAEGQSNIMHQWLNGVTATSTRALNPTPSHHNSVEGLWLNVFNAPPIGARDFNWWLNNGAKGGPNIYMHGPLINFGVASHIPYSSDVDPLWGRSKSWIIRSDPDLAYSNPISLAIDSTNSMPSTVTEYLGCDAQTLKPVFMVNTLASTGSANNSARVYFRKSFSPKMRRTVTNEVPSSEPNAGGIAGKIEAIGYAFGSSISDDLLDFSGNILITSYTKMGLYDEKIFYIDRTGGDFRERAACFSDSNTPVRAIAKCETNCMNYYRVAVLSNTTNCNWVYGEWAPYGPELNSTWRAGSRGAPRSEVEIMTSVIPSEDQKVLTFSCAAS